MCPGHYIPLSELQAYTKKAVAEKLVDQQVRDIEIGKAHIGIGMVHRGKLDKPATDSVAEHDQVSEVYHIIDGTATLMLGPDITNRQRRPATQLTVREFNGPGNNGSEIRGGGLYNLKPGDVVVIPAGTGHWFTKIDDHIDYLMVRIDPDKVTPLKDEAGIEGVSVEARSPVDSLAQAGLKARLSGAGPIPNSQSPLPKPTPKAQSPKRPKPKADSQS